MVSRNSLVSWRLVPGNDEAQWTPSDFGNHAPFGAHFGAIRRIGADLVPTGACFAHRRVGGLLQLQPLPTPPLSAYRRGHRFPHRVQLSRIVVEKHPYRVPYALAQQHEDVYRNGGLVEIYHDGVCKPITPLLELFWRVTSF